MDKLTAIKIKYDDGTYSDEIPISVLSENVEWDSTHTLVDVLGSIDVDVTGTIQYQISQLFNEKISATQLQNYVASQLNEDVSTWLNNNVNPVGSAVIVDSSLTVGGAAADAKKVGNEITGLKIDFIQFEDIITTSTTSEIPVTLDIQIGYYKENGTFVSEAGRQSAVVSPVNSGEKYKINCSLGSRIIYGILFRNNDTVISTLLKGTGTAVDYIDYEFIVPENCDSMIVQTAYPERVQVSLKKEVSERFFNAYTKTETNTLLDTIPKRYGVRWQINNPDDLGERCFSAAGLTASIGVGSTNGVSDFDSIYPWSEIKRCNIKQNANGAKIITYEGESGFALDGSNGDVFVRIPKFYYERYRENGYEYRVISKIGTNVHPAFIESGIELEEIFIGAFEGYVDSGKLKSVGGVIPSSNQTAQEFLTASQANGDGYTLYDMRTCDAIWVLMAIEYGCRNTNQIFGYGYADYFQPVAGQYGIEYDGSAEATNVFSASGSLSPARIGYLIVGTTVTICKGTQANVIATRRLVSSTSDANHYYLTFDGAPVELDSTCFIGSGACEANFCEIAPTGALTWHTGRANFVANSNTKNPVRYRWMENLVGSLWNFFPDITFNNLQMYQCKDIKKYSIGAVDNGYVPVGGLFALQTSNGEKADVVGSNYWIIDMADVSFGKEIDFGKTFDMGIKSDKAFGAYYYLSTGVRIIVNGGGFDHLYRCNMLTNRAWIIPTEKWYLYGARLMYKHLT